MSKVAVLVDLTCKQCGTSFQRPKSNLRQGRGGCCSRQCASAFRVGKNFRGPSTLITRECLCGKTFQVKPSALVNGHGKTCSLSCAAVARNAKRAAVALPKPLVTCPCGKSFPVSPSRSGRRFCSLSCSGKANVALSKPKAVTPKPKPSQRPAPVTPRVDDLPLVDGGSMVRCSGPCGQLRERGRMCIRCEWRAYEVAS